MNKLSTIAEYVAVNYSSCHIDQIEKEYNGNWKVELDNGLELLFDQGFNLIKIDDN